MSTFNLVHFFGNTSSSSNKGKRQRGRVCRIEELESRELLSVTLGEFAAIREQYADINLSENMDDYTIFEVGGTDEGEGQRLFNFSATGLQNAINTAENGTLIVVRTDTQDKIALGGVGSELKVSKNITIVSLGASNLTIDANKESQVFVINSGATVAMAGLTITNGYTQGNGGGIYNSGILTLTDCTIIGNSATGSSGSGGGVYNGGTLTIANSIITKNLAGVYGGGIFSDTALTVTNCAITENSTADNGMGGGIYIHSGTSSVMNCIIISNSAALGGGIGNLGVLTVMNCTVAENSVTGGNGGGIYNALGYAGINRMTLANCAIVGNSAIRSGMLGGFGGGIYTTGSNTLAVTNCTVAGNSATRNGGGLFHGSGTLTINNSIVAQNSDDIFRDAGTLSGNNNLIGDGTGQSSLNDGFGGNIVGAAPLFVNIQGNDWTKWDLRLAVGSPAIDKGNNTLAINAEEKPLTMDLDGNTRIVGDRVDIGAYEHGSFPIFPPSTPINFRSTEKTSNSATLTWSAANKATSYEVRYREKGADDEGWTDIIDITATSRTITQLSDSTEYEFQVRATHGGGESEWSESIFITTDPLVPPVTPTGLSSNDKTVNSVALEWDSVANATSYEVQYRKIDDEEWTNVTVTETSTAIGSLAAGMTYQFQVLAVNIEGKSEWSDKITIATLLLTPTGLTDIEKSTNSITLEWDEVSGATNYEIQYNIGSETKTVTVSGTSESITELADNTTYEFKIRAKSAVSESAWSAIVSVTTDRIPVPPTTPDNFHDTAKSTNSITLSWNSVSNATSYEIQYRTGNEEWVNVPVTQTTVTIGNLIENTIYQFQVLAVNADGKSEWSDAITVTTDTMPTVPPIAPTNFRSTEQGVNSAMLTWDSQAGLTGYTLQYKLSTDSQWTTWTTAPTSTATSATITGLLANTSYDFRLTAMNAAGSVHSETTATTSNIPAIAPVKPKVKADSKQATINSVTLTFTAPKRNSTLDSNAEYAITCTTVIRNGSSKQTVEIGLTEGGNLEFIRNDNGTITGIKVTGLAQNTSYRFAVVAQNADSVSVDAVNVTAKTKRYTAISTKVDTRGTIVTAGETHGSTRTTIDSVTLTWLTANRPAEEKYEIKVWDTKAKVYITVAPENLVQSSGTDKKGNALTTLTVKGLRAGSKYTVEIKGYIGEVGEPSYQESALRKAKITTAKFNAVSKIQSNAVLTENGNAITLIWQIPTGTRLSPNAVYIAYEIDWVVSRTEQKSVAFVLSDNTSATILMSTLSDLGIDLSSTKRHNFVIRAVILTEDDTTVINQSLDGKFSITPSKLI